MAGLTPTGFTIPTVDEIISAVSTQCKSLIDDKLNTEANSALGQLIGILAEREHRLWLTAQDVYSAFTPAGASGYALAQLCLLTGTKKLDKSKSLVTATVNLNGGFTLPAGSQANVEDNTDAVFETVEDISNPGGSPDYFPVVMRAVTEGPVRANAGTLTNITTPIVGWNLVTNAEDAELGRLVETDPALRARRELEIRSQGSANLDAIEAKVRTLLDQEVSTATPDVVGRENTDSVDGDIPAKSFEIVLWDGDPTEATDNDIAQAIWDSKPAGILAYGTSSGTATDASGESRTVGFSRATGVDIYIELDIEIDADEFPSDGDDQIKTAIVDYAESRWRIGADVAPSALYGSVFSVSGVLSVDEVRIGIAPSPVGTGNISVAFGEKGLADTSRIDVSHV